MSKKILIVDDEEILLKMLSTRLESGGFNVEFARNGEECLASVRTKKPDLIVLDILMPKKDGYTVCEELRRDPATSNMKIVMLTALAEDLDRQRGFDAGADAYLTKPFSPTTLLQKVNELLPQNEPAL